MLALIFVAGALDVTAPVLSLPTGTQTGSTTATGTVSTDESGTLYFWATENASETAADIKTNGSSQAATTGVQNVSFTGLTAATIFFAHYVEDDVSSNESNVVSSTAFTTAAISDFTGGWWVQYEKQRQQQEEERAKRKEARKRSQEIKDELDRLIALEQRKLEENAARLVELNGLTSLAKEYKQDLHKSTDDRMAFIAKTAINKQTFSAMERLERELFTMSEEEEFLLMATMVIINEQ